MKRSVSMGILSFVIVMGGAAAARAQSSYLKRGQYGIGLSGVYATNSGASGFSGTAGVGLAGIFDLSLSLGGAKYEPGSLQLPSLKATSIATGLRAHVIKQNSSRSPVSLAVAVGYARDNFRSPDLAAAGLDMWANTVEVGGTVYRDVRLARRAYLQPFAGISYEATTLKLQNAAGLTVSSKDDLASINAGLPLVYDLSQRALVVVEPALRVNRDTTTFSVSAGLVLRLSSPTR